MHHTITAEDIVYDNPEYKLTHKQIKEMRRKYKQGLTYYRLASLYPASPEYCKQIVTKEVFKDI